MLQFTLDTFCVIAAAQDQGYRDKVDQLVDLARAGHVELWLTSAFTYDQSTAPNDKRQANLQWLSDRPLIGSVPGPFRFDLSPLDGSDVFVSDEMAEADEKIKTILLARGQVAPGSRNIHDVHHLAAHLIAGHDAFITNDSDMLKPGRRELLRSQVGIAVLDPAEAVARATE
jgi:hypothetical protein